MISNIIGLTITILFSLFLFIVGVYYITYSIVMKWCKKENDKIEKETDKVLKMINIYSIYEDTKNSLDW